MQMWRLVRLSGLLLLIALLPVDTQGASAQSGPASYAGFKDATTFKNLTAALAASEQLYFPPGRYRVDNPLVIDRDRPLFLHGADRIRSVLVGKHPGLPLLVINRASVVSLASLRLQASNDADEIERAAIQTLNTAPLQLEMLDCTVRNSRLVFHGPGTIRIQGTSFFPHGHVTASILVDHPNALLTLVGGNISNDHSTVRVRTSEASHVRLRHGRLRIYGTGLQGAIGPTDIRIDAPSSHGPHVIAGVRSEGSNGANRGTYKGLLLRVPPTPLPVDVIVKGNIAAWKVLGAGLGTLVEYSGSGRLWLIGNDGLFGVGALVRGDTSRAHVIAAGNLVYGGHPLAPVSTALTKLGANLFLHNLLTGSKKWPLTRFLPPSRDLPQDLGPIPRISVPPPLGRPRVTTALPGMLNVRSFGAIGDGIHDDTQALQRALDTDCGSGPKPLFLPAGIYRTTDTLRFNHVQAACRRHRSGGWIAGAGSSRTIIRRDAAGGGGVFATQGMAFATIQGITFQTRPYRRSDPSPVREAAFALENTPGVGPSSQGISFYDVRFDGGRYALGIGIESPQQCSENLLVDATFEHAHIGLAVGAYNALSNTVYRGRFDVNDITMGQPERGLAGGTWLVLGATVRGTRDRELNLRSTASGAWYLHGIDSDTPRLVSIQGTGAPYPILLDDSTLRPRARPARARYIDFGASGGVAFLHSSLTRLIPSRVGTGIASSYMLGFDSQLPDLAKVSVGKNAIVSQTGAR